jgi:hypothetical protein
VCCTSTMNSKASLGVDEVDASKPSQLGVAPGLATAIVVSRGNALLFIEASTAS